MKRAGPFALLIAAAACAARVEPVAPPAPPPARALAVPPDAVKVGGDVREPQKIKHVQPRYPREARMARAQGTVTLEVVIGNDGRISDLVVRKGVHPALDEASVAAVRQWEYEPTTRDGKPVPVLMTVTASFFIQ